MPQVIVEFAPATEDVLNARVTRRLIQLELAEAKLTPNPKRQDQPLDLFYRLLLEGTKELRIELWERGEFYGARRVSAAHGDKKVLARHVALATAELAQRLSRAHSQKVEELERERKHALQAKLAEAKAARRERWNLVSRADTAWLLQPNLWLAGPRLGFQLNQARRGRLEITGGWLFGSGSALPDVEGLEWLELKLAPAYRFDDSDLAVGFDLAAAMLLFAGSVSVDGIPEQRQTWSARGGLHLHFQPELSRRLRLHIGAETSFMLREVQLTPHHGSATDLQGLWLGLNLGLLLGS